MNYFQKLQLSIDFIENNLIEDIALIEVAEKANCSIFHFHRLFQAIVGNSIKEYIRKRRLTHAAKDLVETKKSIIDIAFDYQYGAPESFSRAFKKMYGKTPWDYRKEGLFIPLNEKADLLAINMEEVKRGMKMKPAIKEKDEFIVVGVEVSTQHSSCQQDVPNFWRKYSQKHSLKRLGYLKNSSEILGLCFGNCNGKCGESSLSEILPKHENQFNYLICSEVQNSDDVPEGFHIRKIPKAKYAVFTIKGGFQKIQKGVESIYKNWLSNTSYELADSPHFEKYNDDWSDSEDSTMEIWIPIK